MSTTNTRWITNVSQHARPLDAGPVLGPGERVEVSRTGKGDAHYAELGDLVIHEEGWEPPAPEQADETEAETSEDGQDDEKSQTTSGRGRGKAGAQ